ncbi:DeoR/GlpR family DNA-binding transcription regulator [Paenilisteria rocourtiae]|uniref:DeoR family transcriptional regulator n=1 Tax=Listeria rocourtiae TaxID=647910 RepID=A0A4R6ZJN4_9LIST|nr:DeoR/GlpR family DNA-binding transcription regulator [Listeria rocourtiae]EUJ47779.1 DeoR family transcriptional regulator [Listeria rocourtiae FSL F6-920]TDR52577.1 DeoR family transcriptional regulator [Listeria rocourtiae]
MLACKSSFVYNEEDKDVMKMLAFERKDKILSEIKKNKKVHVSQLAKIFSVSEETIRRDLDKLEKEGIVERSYGGATLSQHTNEDLPYATRNIINVEEKKVIAGKTTSLIKAGDSLIADTSSTVFEALNLLVREKENLTIITNSITAVDLLSKFKVQLILTGGTLRTKSNSLIGSDAANTISRYFVDYAIISCKGISMENGITDSNEPEAEIKNHMLKRANKVILVADASKFDKSAFINIVDISEIDYLITDQEPSHEWRQFLKEKNVTLIY